MGVLCEAGLRDRVGGILQDGGAGKQGKNFRPWFPYHMLLERRLNRHLGCRMIYIERMEKESGLFMRQHETPSSLGRETTGVRRIEEPVPIRACCVRAMVDAVSQLLAQGRWRQRTPGVRVGARRWQARRIPSCGRGCIHRR